MVFNVARVGKGEPSFKACGSYILLRTLHSQLPRIQHECVLSNLGKKSASIKNNAIMYRMVS